jgi:hypothetical protein
MTAKPVVLGGNVFVLESELTCLGKLKSSSIILKGFGFGDKYDVCSYS